MEGEVMKLRILKPGETIVEAEVRQVTLAGLEGQSTPMDGHEYMLTLLKPGPVIYARSDRPEAERERVDIARGVAEVLPYAVTIFVEGSAERK